MPVATFAFVAGDDSWNVELDGAAATRLETAKSPDVTARGTTSALLLAVYGRVPWTSLEIEGDGSLLTDWSKSITF